MKTTTIWSTCGKLAALAAVSCAHAAFEPKLTSPLDGWKIERSLSSPEPGLELLKITLTSDSVRRMPRMCFVWKTPNRGFSGCRHSAARSTTKICPDWSGGGVNTRLTSQIPYYQVMGSCDDNLELLAVSDCFVETGMGTKIREETLLEEWWCNISANLRPETNRYEVTLRWDTRAIPFDRAQQDMTRWFGTFPETSPVRPPEAAFAPVYSTWYSYHQNVFQKELEDEFARAAALGCKTVILDDGWQTDDNNRGYAFTGDWVISTNRFPDMKAHVRRVHGLGMKYVVWYATPLVGAKSAAWPRFKDKCIGFNKRSGHGTLDPRYPEVREFLISTFENAVREYDYDGLKLDFIDGWREAGRPGKGADYTTVCGAVDRLMTDIMSRLKAIKPDILIEFRQSYIGPAIRKYGNMLRVGDCPADYLSNRDGTMGLRLTSGETAVHSDMIRWHPDCATDEAAMQLLNVIFGVPQISVKIAELKEDHVKMLRFWLGFIGEHRDTLYHGDFRAYGPQSGWTAGCAETEKERVLAVFAANVAADARTASGKRVYVVNASGVDSVVADVTPGSRYEIRNVIGEVVARGTVEVPVVRLAVPNGGLVIFIA